MKPTKYTALSADWNVNLKTAEFSSPSKDHERFISEPVMEDVKSQIAKSDVVVVDFTNKNPNVLL
jgi:hypothetical protein